MSQAPTQQVAPLHLWERLAEAKSRLAPVESKYRVLWEPQEKTCAAQGCGHTQSVNIEHCEKCGEIIPTPAACVTVPDLNWMAAALAGGILPPIDTYLRDRDVPDGQPKEHPYAETIGAMTEEEAIVYLIMKDIPPSVWRDYQGNRSILRIVPVNLIPSDRSFRNAWRVNQEMELAA